MNNSLPLPRGFASEIEWQCYLAWERAALDFCRTGDAVCEAWGFGFRQAMVAKAEPGAGLMFFDEVKTAEPLIIVLAGTRAADHALDFVISDRFGARILDDIALSEKRFGAPMLNDIAMHDDAPELFSNRHARRAYAKTQRVRRR